MFFAPAVRSHCGYSPRAFDRSFERFFNDAFVQPRTGFSLEQDDTSWTLSLDLPGLAREDLSIAIDEAVVRIETQTEAKRKFKAAYELPQAIDAAASSAKLENGVLTLKLAKLAPVSNVTQLHID